MFGKSPTNAFQSGANHPMYGKVAANAMTVNVYTINNVLVRSFTSQVAAAEWLNVNQSTVSKYIKSGKVWNNKYLFRIDSASSGITPPCWFFPIIGDRFSPPPEGDHPPYF